MTDYLPDLKIGYDEGLCLVCSKSTNASCSACGGARYCSTEHQNADWENHKRICLPYKILANDILGRYAVAVRDLLPGEIIVREYPVVFGPKHYTPPVCLGCLTPVTSADKLRLCSKCRWPACSYECEISKIHAENECPIFASSHVHFLWNPSCIGGEVTEESITIPDNPMLQCITPLRLLLAKEKDPKRWEEEVVPMESHMEKRFDSKAWKSDMINVCGFLRKACHLAERFSIEDIMWACGILEVNAFEARSGKGGKARCIYPLLAIFSHSCTPNITHTIDSQFNMKGRVSVAVSQGQILNTCYTYTLSTTLERRECLREGKFFDCICKRCIDPSELGTDFSSVLCNKCPEGKLMPKYPTEPHSIWMCTVCEEEKSALYIESLLDSLKTPGSRIKGIKYAMDPNRPLVLEEAVKRCSSVLHQNHSLIINLKVSLVEIYGNAGKLPVKDYLPIMLEHKIKLCQDVLKVADVIEPGLSRLRGKIIYEMCEPLELLVKSKFYNTLECNGNSLKYIMVLKKFLEEAIIILSLEASDSPEAKMCINAKENLIRVEKFMEDNFLQSDLISQEKCLESLSEVFQDQKLNLNLNKEEVLEDRKGDKKILPEFAKEINATDFQTSATSSNLIDIIQTLKIESQDEFFGDLQYFEDMLNSFKVS